MMDNRSAGQFGCLDDAAQPGMGVDPAACGIGNREMELGRAKVLHDHVPAEERLCGSDEAEHFGLRQPLLKAQRAQAITGRQIIGQAAGA